MQTAIADEESVLWSYQGDTTGGAPAPLNGVTVINVDPTQEYVAGGNGYYRGMGEAMLPDTIDDLTSRHGFKAYEWMKTLPAVSSSLRTLKLGILSGEFKLLPTHPVKPGAESKDQDQINSEETTAFCQRIMDRVEGFRSSALQLLDAAEDGNKLAEMTGRLETEGEDAGRIVLKSLNVKKREAWEFIVDRSYNVTGILARDENGRRVRLKPDKFLWLSWFLRDNDPRGTSILRSAYTAWALAVKVFPQYYKYLLQHAVPSLIGMTAPNEPDRKLPDGKIVKPEHYFRLVLERFQNGSAMVHPNGAHVYTVPITGEGAVFLNAFEFFNREIVYAILMQTRATKEAEHGSKADSEQGGNILGLLLEYGQQLCSEAFRNRLFKYFVRLNYGATWAEKYTPYLQVGAGDPADKVALANAFANLMRAGAITDSIKSEAYSDFGLPVPDVKADKASAREAMLDAQAPFDEPEDEGDNSTESGDEGDKSAE